MKMSKTMGLVLDLLQLTLTFYKHVRDHGWASWTFCLQLRINYLQPLGKKDFIHIYCITTMGSHLTFSSDRVSSTAFCGSRSMHFHFKRKNHGTYQVSDGFPWISQGFFRFLLRANHDNIISPEGSCDAKEFETHILLIHINHPCDIPTPTVYMTSILTLKHQSPLITHHIPIFVHSTNLQYKRHWTLLAVVEKTSPIKMIYFVWSEFVATLIELPRMSSQEDMYSAPMGLFASFRTLLEDHPVKWKKLFQKRSYSVFRSFLRFPVKWSLHKQWHLLFQHVLHILSASSSNRSSTKKHWPLQDSTVVRLKNPTLFEALKNIPKTSTELQLFSGVF